jgi:Adenine specific DNA methylase Mod
LQNLFNDLENLLQQEQSFISDGAILKNAVVEAALNLDSRLLELLMQSDTIKAHFFTEISGVLVFDKVKFQDFVSNKAFLPDSYTAFKNRIGLTDGGREYLSQSRDVVLAWPYKDCVLEGGMTKEDRGRNEVFWNTTLAPDDITRLFEPKVLTGWERWDAEAIAADNAKPVGEVSEDDNLLIKGNNLLALHSLKARYAGKVKLIYIDPPYNTGNDGFRYNDRFNHSAWLTFMRNRLEVAKDLLSRDGVIFVNLDDGEAHYCKVLLDEVFGRENFVANIVWQKKYAPQNDAKWFSDDHDHILCFAKSKSDFSVNLLPRSEEARARYSNPDNDPRGDWKSSDLTRAEYRERDYYGIVTPSGREVFPAKGRSWSRPKEEIERLRQDNRLWFGARGDAMPSLKRFITEVKDGAVPQTLFQYKDVGHTQDAARELSALGFGGIFGTPKPEYLIQRIIHIASNPGDLVLDFYAGSGTTAAVAHKMGRQWIAVEQMAYIQDFPLVRFHKVIEGEQGGVSKEVGWQGGGSFIYAELAQSNSTFVDSIESAQDIDALQSIYAEIKASGYLRYDVDLSAFDFDDFSALDLGDAKRVLMDCLDANHLYVNLSSLGDTDFEISEEDAAANRSFYGIAP